MSDDSRTLATREELDASAQEFREGLLRDRDERLGHFIRLETKMDLRFSEITKMLSEFIGKTSDVNARVVILEKSTTDVQSRYEKLSSKMDRNWGVILSLFTSIVLYIIITMLGKVGVGK